MRKVVIATPSYDGKINVWHTAALVETCKLGLANNINFCPLYIAHESIIHIARNDLVQLFLESDFEDIIFIDSDVDWNPSDVLKLLEHNCDIVGAALIKKTDSVHAYTVKLLGKYNLNTKTNLAEVDGLGCGMIKISRHALQEVWNNSVEYLDKNKEIPNRMVFETCVKDGKFWSEDIYFCQKWKDLGGKIFLDPSINLGHTGEKRWIGNFSGWMKIVETQKKILPKPKKKKKQIRK